MGGAVSSGRMTTLIQTLKQEHCPSSHQIWLEITIDDMPNQYLSEEDIHNLIIIKNKQPDNFSSLVRATIEVFSQASKISDIENSQNSKYINVCNFICLLLSISNDLNNNNSCNCWLKLPQTNVSAMKPILSLMDTLQRLLRFNDPIQLFLQSSILDLRISYTKTLLFLIHAKSLGGNLSESDPSQFLLTFDSFCWNRFLHELFEIIPITLSSKEKNIISEKEQLLVRSLITTAIPCLYSCSNWNIQQINVNLVQSSFSILKQYGNTKVISLSEQLVTFFFITISNHPEFLDYIFSTNQTIEYIISLLYFYQIRFFENKRSSFFHKIILIIIIMLTSSPKQLSTLNEPFNGHFTIRNPETIKIHKGTNADLIIEVTTNPIIFDSNSLEYITSLISDVILNLSETAANLSFFSGNRLFLVLKKLFASGLYQKVEFANSIKDFLCSIFQMLRFNSKSNLRLFTMATENERLLKFILSSSSQIHLKKANSIKVPNKKSLHELASLILKMVETASSSLKVTEKNDRVEIFNELIEKVVSKFNDEPEKAEKINLESLCEIETVWFDWLRLLFFISFPKEARKAGLTFASFEFDSKGRGRDRLDHSQISGKQEKTQKQKQEQIQKQEKIHEQEQIQKQEKTHEQEQIQKQEKIHEQEQTQKQEQEQIQTQEPEHNTQHPEIQSNQIDNSLDFHEEQEDQRIHLESKIALNHEHESENSINAQNDEHPSTQITHENEQPQIFEIQKEMKQQQPEIQETQENLIQEKNELIQQQEEKNNELQTEKQTQHNKQEKIQETQKEEEKKDFFVDQKEEEIQEKNESEFQDEEVQIQETQKLDENIQDEPNKTEIQESGDFEIINNIGNIFSNANDDNNDKRLVNNINNDENDKND